MKKLKLLEKTEIQLKRTDFDYLERGSVLFPGKFNVFHNGHFWNLMDNLHEDDDLVICIIGNIETADIRAKWINLVLPKNVKRRIVWHPTGYLPSICIQNFRGMPNILCGEDRIEEYKKQFTDFNADERAFVLTERFYSSSEFLDTLPQDLMAASGMIPQTLFNLETLSEIAQTYNLLSSSKNS